MNSGQPPFSPVSNASLLATVTFREISLELGIDLGHQQSSEHLSALTETLGAGVCVLDANQDGWMDLFFVGGSGHNRSYGRDAWWNKHTGNRLLLNQDGETFADATQAAGLDKVIWGFSCRVGDMDNDGLDDIIVAGLNSITLYRNTGSASFSEYVISSPQDKTLNPWPSSISLADFNGDGLLDFYVANYILYQKGTRTFEQTTGFQSSVETDFNPALYDPAANRLYKNLGDLKFADVADTLGVANAQGRSLAAQWLDLNTDNWPDLLVVNNASPNQVFINQQGKSFRREQGRYEALEISDSHSLILSDTNRDNRLDFLYARPAGMPPVFLQQNTTRSALTDTAWDKGIARIEKLPFSSWDGVVADFNNDSHVDIFLANGSTLPDPDSDFVSQAQSNRLLLNQGNDHYLDAPATTDKLAPYSSRGAVSVDIDNDGYLELVVSNNNERLQVFKNSADRTYNWLGLVLQAPHGQADIYGSHITVSTATQQFTQQLVAPQATFSQSDPRLHFGLADTTEVEKITIRWRDGSKQVFKNLPANRYYRLDKQKKHPQPVVAKALTGHKNTDFFKAKLADAPLQDYLDIAFLANAASVELLSTAWENSNPAFRLWLLDKIAQYWQRKYLPLLKRGLESNDQKLQIKALDILQKTELEISVAWLLPLLFAENKDIQCKVARAFQFFFEQEEALIHRKYLAVPYLIRLLDPAEQSVEVQICAIQALAAAEKKSAVYPLKNMAEHSNSLEVQIAAITALGLIRDRLSLALLQTFSSADNINSVNAALLSASFIARARLADPALERDMENFFVFSKAKAAKGPLLLSQRANTLSNLYQNTHGIVFNSNKLNRYLETILQQAQETPGLPTNESISVINSVTASKAPKYAKHLVFFLQRSDKTLVSKAFSALLTVGNPLLIRLHETLIFSQPKDIQAALLYTASQRQYTFSFNVLKQLLAENINQAEIVKAVSEQLLLLSPEDASGLLASAIPLTNESRILSILLHTCKQQSIQWHASLAALDQKNSMLTKAALLPCALQNLAEAKPFAYQTIRDLLQQQDEEIKKRLVEAFSEDQFSVDKRQLIRDIYADQTIALNERQTFLIAMAEKDVIIAKKLYSKGLHEIDENLLPSAISALARHGLTENLKEEYAGLLKNPDKPIAIRLKAGKFLAANDAGKTYNYVKQALAE